MPGSKIFETAATAAKMREKGMNDETKPAGNGGNGGLKCSACGKGMGEIRKLIVWDDGGICDECVDLCAEILREELDPGFSPPTGLPRTFPEGSRIGSVGGDTIFVVVPEHVEEVPKSWTVDDEGDELVARPPEPEPKSTDGKSGLKTASG